VPEQALDIESLQTSSHLIEFLVKGSLVVDNALSSELRVIFIQVDFLVTEREDFGTITPNSRQLDS
jgi:hypothetical protein